MKPEPEHHRVWWNGILLDVRYERRWLSVGGDGEDVAHLEVVSVYPDYAPLPITETGYRSHFTSDTAIAAAGGAVTYVLAWLRAESQSRAWRDRDHAARQFSLF